MRALALCLSFITLTSASHLHLRTNPPITSPTSIFATSAPTAILIAPPHSPTTSTCDPTPYADCTPYSNSTFSPPTAHFGPTSPATLRVDTEALAAVTSALASATSTWTNGPLYPSLKSAVYEAAPTPAQLSLAVSGYDWDSIVRSDWYSSVPSEWQEMITEEQKKLQHIFDNVTGQHLMVMNRACGGLGVGRVLMTVLVGVWVLWFW